MFCLVLGLNSLSLKLTALRNENKSYLTEIQNSYKKAVPDAPSFSNFKQLKSVLLKQNSSGISRAFPNTPLAVLERLSERLPDKENHPDKFQYEQKYCFNQCKHHKLRRAG